MKVVKNESSAVWHLVGSRGCGVEPAGECIENSWAMVRDRVDRGDGTRCSKCRWPQRS